MSRVRLRGADGQPGNRWEHLDHEEQKVDVLAAVVQKSGMARTAPFLTLPAADCWLLGFFGRRLQTCFLVLSDELEGSTSIG